MYPYALNRLLINPTRSPVVDKTVQTLIRSPSLEEDGKKMIIDRNKIRRLLKDSASITGLSQRRVIWDIVKTKPGRKLTRSILVEELRRVLSAARKRVMRIDAGSSRRKRTKNDRWYYLRL